MIQNGNLRTTAGAGVRPSSRVARSEAIIFTELDGAVVMMDADAGSYYELDPVGARIWALAESSPSVAKVCETLITEYEVAPDTCVGDVTAFLKKLHRRGVIRVLSGDDLKGNGGNETHGGSLTRSPSAAAPRGGGKEPGAKFVWTTPEVRALQTKSIASAESWYRSPGETPDYDIYPPPS